MDPTLHTFLEEEQIKALLLRERFYRDSQQWEKLRNSYHPDPEQTSINISWFNGNADQFVKGSIEMSRKGTNAIHNVTPIEVHIRGSKALSVSVGSIMVRFRAHGGEYDCTSYGRFISRLEKVEGLGWRLKTLEVIYDRDSIVSTSPKNQSLDIDVGSYRESYKYLAFVLAQGGYKINNDLPGTDQPKTAEALMNSHFKWLNEK